MTMRMNRVLRRVAPLLSAGVLLQAGGCAFDTNTLVLGLLTSIAQSIITDLVFGLFNVAAF